MIINNKVMDYKAFLELVKQQNPDMPTKEQQKLASEKNKEFNANLKQQQLASQKTPNFGETKTEQPLDLGIKDDITLTTLMQVEKRIRAIGVDVNSVISLGREAIPGGKLEKHGKEGVNTKVTFADANGNKLPVNGFFYIYI
jgi:hypothetical protein